MSDLGSDLYLKRSDPNCTLNIVDRRDTMADIVLKTIQATDDIAVILYEQTEHRGFYHISIKHTPIRTDMPGEIMLAPSHTPALVKALTEAALQLTLFTGLSGGKG